MFDHFIGLTLKGLTILMTKFGDLNPTESRLSLPVTCYSDADYDDNAEYLSSNSKTN